MSDDNDLAYVVEGGNRSLRNTLLAETDFYALGDVTMPDSIATYRQALRDLTNHENWPDLNEEDWPTKPSV